jgi:hypothetical protein
VDDGPPQIEIAQQHRAFRQVRLGQSQVDELNVLPSAGDGLVTTTVCSGCNVCR